MSIKATILSAFRAAEIHISSMAYWLNNSTTTSAVRETVPSTKFEFSTLIDKSHLGLTIEADAVGN
jgi:hypothetical protein